MASLEIVPDGPLGEGSHHFCFITSCDLVDLGHGQEDYLTGKRCGLPTLMPVDTKGRFDKTAGEFSGMDVYKANPLIVEKLKLLGKLVAAGEASHSYPHCMNCGTSIEQVDPEKHKGLLKTVDEVKSEFKNLTRNMEDIPIAEKKGGFYKDVSELPGYVDPYTGEVKE